MPHPQSLSLLLILVFVVLVTRPTVAAEEPADGPKTIFKDDFIENLVGQWNITRQVRGKEVHNAMTAEWVLNHQFLKLHMKDTADPPQYEAIILIGYSHADQQ